MRIAASLLLVAALLLAGCSIGPNTAGNAPTADTETSAVDTGTAATETRTSTADRSTRTSDPGTTTGDSGGCGSDASASVTFTNQSVDTSQSANGTTATLTVSNVTLETGAFIVVTPNGSAAPSDIRVLGVSSYLPAGHYAEVTVTLDERIEEPRRLSVVVLEDTSGDQTADLDGSDEIALDGCGGHVGDAATVYPTCDCWG